MSTVKANDLMKVDGGIPTVKGQQLIPTAWVRFNSVGTVVIQNSENISSITDNGVGSYNINFTAALSNLLYCVTGSSEAVSLQSEVFNPVTPVSTTTCQVITSAANTLRDMRYIVAIVMGGQA